MSALSNIGSGKCPRSWPTAGASSHGEADPGHELHPPSALRRGELTQAELAERIGVTRQTVIAIEQGRYSPSLELAFQIAHVFKVPLDDVFQYPGSEGETP